MTTWSTPDGRWSARVAAARRRGNYKCAHLTYVEREYIGRAWAEGKTVREIAAALNRHPSTIYNVTEPPISKALTRDQFNRGRDAICLGCGFDRIMFDTDGNGNAFDSCPKCKWTRYFGRVA